MRDVASVAGLGISVFVVLALMVMAPERFSLGDQQPFEASAITLAAD